MSSKANTLPKVSGKSPGASGAEGAVARIAIAEDGRIAYASPAFCDLSHKSLDVIQNMPAEALIRFSEFTNQDMDIAAIHAGPHRVFINGNSEALEFQFDWLQTPDDRRYLVGFENGENPEISRTILTAFVAEIPPLQKLSEPVEDMRQVPLQPLAPGDFTSEDFKRLLGLSRQAVIITSACGRVLHVNEVFCALSGYSPEELAGMGFADMFDALDRPRVLAVLRAIGEPAFDVEDFEARIVGKDGRVCWTEWSLESAEGKLYCSGRDVSALKSQQEALEHRERQLSAAESIGRMGHWNWTIGYPEMEWSQEIFRIFGVDPEEFAPGLDTMNKMVHRDDIARVNQAFQRALIEENDYDMEFRVRRPDGELRYIRCEGRCARDALGEVYALYGIMQDMTERMIYERQLREAKDASERAYAAKTQFLANMSHELRTPLNAIIGFSEMIERQLLGPIGTEKYLDYVGGIRESGEHLLDLISDILDMSKIEAGKYVLDLEELQVGKVIKLAVHMIEGRARDAGVRVSIDQDLDEDFKIVADRRAVLQILLNLLSNAVKFTNEGGQVSLQCKRERGERISIKIIDNGIGIPAGKLNTITKPFEQVSSSYARNHEGSGLGLAITKELVEMHGGNLIIESTLRVGTTVIVRLPCIAQGMVPKEA
ncbi:MAG: PAS domain-containing protein [Alphaproteobacteria bacterium]|nr:PAS domain-containing protein [Alphaproteobacteria bacterium]